MAKNYYEAKFGSRTVVFYPLTLKQIQDFSEDILAMREGISAVNSMDPARFGSLMKIFLASARRGKAEITEEDVSAVVDLENAADVVRACLGQKSARPLTADEAALPTSPLNGGKSMPLSSPPPDGAGETSTS